jgi:4-amino-4-deoxy-L-arabinose transferase-like glycosyltransferase
MTKNPFQGVQLIVARNKIFSDIRFWLILLAIMRLYAITLPPLELQHAWRQADGLMIARNFLETDSNIFYPRVDTAGEKTGITGSEFPILYYLIYLVSLVFSYQPWYGRVIVLVFSTLGSFYFYKSIKKFFGETVAFNAAIILTASLWFSYSRKIFPDCFAAGLCLMALYFVLTYLEKGKWVHLALYIILGSLGILSKISCGLILSVLAIPIIFGKYPNMRRVWMLVGSFVIIVCVIEWYFVWVPYLNDTYGYGDHFTMGYPFSTSWEQIVANWREILKRLFIVPVKYLGVVIFIGSLVYILYRKKWTMFSLFIIPYICFLLVILKTGQNIIADQYYILCVIPVMAFVSGYGLAQIFNKKIMLFILMITAIENIGDQINDFRIHKVNAAFSDLESIVDSVSNRDDLFVMNTDPYCPTAMYFAHRKGWTVYSRDLTNQSFIEDLKKKNCRFALVCKRLYSEDYDVTLNLPQVFESNDFRIYSLE